MTFTMDTFVSRVPDSMSTEVDGDLVILGMSTSSYIALDPIGKRIWERIEGPVRVEDLCQGLAQEYRGPLEQITADVLKFLQDLKVEGLVQEHGQTLG